MFLLFLFKYFQINHMSLECKRSQCTFVNRSLYNSHTLHPLLCPFVSENTFLLPWYLMQTYRTLDRNFNLNLRRSKLLRHVCAERTDLRKEEYVSQITPRPSMWWFWPTTAATPWWVSSTAATSAAVTGSVLTQPHPQVGQVHGGLLGVIQRSMVRSCPHVWFERAEMKDRHAVTSRWG